jgi:hypothetical protein
VDLSNDHREPEQKADAKGQQGELCVAHPLQPPNRTRNLPLQAINTAAGKAPMPKRGKA